MSFVASVSDVVNASRSDCFAQLRDFSSWRRFMPRSFRPLRGPDRALEVGDRLFILISPKVGSLPFITSVTLVRVVTDREITWRGGIPGVFVGEHAFLFEDAEGGGTLVRSQETCTGALTSFPPTARSLLAAASQVGRDQIDALARAVGAPRAARG